MTRRLTLSLILAAACALSAAAPAFAVHQPSGRALRAIRAAVLPANNPYFHCGRVAWARISSAGPYAIASVSAKHRPHSCVDQVQPGLFLVKRHDGRWQTAIEVHNQFCPRVPVAVLADFRAYLAGRNLIHPGTALSSDCIGRIARS